MLKAILSPVQQWLIKRGQCVGCGMPLAKGTKKQSTLGELVVCKCGRGYFRLQNGQWRRALQSEMKG